MRELAARLVTGKRVRQFGLMTGDLVVCFGAYLLAWTLRFAPEPIPTREAAELWSMLPVLLALRLASLLQFNLYRLAWR
jgi:hypothetical protein